MDPDFRIETLQCARHSKTGLPKKWETLENIISSLDMLSKLVANLRVPKDIFSKPHLSFSTSTELAYMLVRKYKVPFRTAHRIVGSLIRILTEYKLAIDDVTPKLLQKVAQDSSGILLNINTEDIREATDPLKIVKSHNARGGPSPIEVKRMLKIRKQWIVLARSKLSGKKRKLNEAEDRLQSVVQSYSSSGDARATPSDPSIEEASPLFFSSIILVFLTATAEFAVPGILGVPGDFVPATVSVWECLAWFPAKYGVASALSLVLLVICRVTLYPCQRMMKKGSRVSQLSRRESLICF